MAGLAVVACVLRRGALALHSGQAMLVLLPWIVLLGASVELPAAVLLRDGCDQLEDFTYRTLTTVTLALTLALPPTLNLTPNLTATHTPTPTRRGRRSPRSCVRASPCTAT